MLETMGRDAEKRARQSSAEEYAGTVTRPLSQVPGHLREEYFTLQNELRALESSSLHVVHLSHGIGRGCGPAAVALNLAKVQLRQGWDTQVWCMGAENEVIAQPECNGFPINRVLRFPPWGPKFLGFSWQLQRAAGRDSRAHDAILHQHGIWQAVSAATRSWSKHRRGPTIVAPHGSLARWALGRSRWKKTLALRAYERENLRNASCLHALSVAEAEDIREFGLRNPIAIVPNGISRGWVSSSGHPDSFRARHCIPREKRILLFLSRITPIKGLPMFVECLQNAGNSFADWVFIIAGPDEFRHQAEVAALVNKYGLTASVKFVGPLFGFEKRNAFAAADAFVLPSYREGWPMAVLEALGAGVPVLTSVATPLSEIANVAVGWRVEASVEPMTAALLELLGTPRSVLAEMGARGRQFVMDHLSWEAASDQLGLVYGWLKGWGPRPSFVIPSA